MSCPTSDRRTYYKRQSIDSASITEEDTMFEKRKWVNKWPRRQRRTGGEAVHDTCRRCRVHMGMQRRYARQGQVIERFQMPSFQICQLYGALNFMSQVLTLYTFQKDIAKRKCKKVKSRKGRLDRRRVVLRGLDAFVAIAMKHYVAAGIKMRFSSGISSASDAAWQQSSRFGPYRFDSKWFCLHPSKSNSRALYN